MTEQYNESVAAHYAAYRPPLQQLILQRARLGTDHFPVGVDVGCGTGRSSVALADLCDHVYAIDPSQSMIDAATPHHAITYQRGSGEQMPVADQSVDIVTFAGSLSYTDFRPTVRELCRVCRPNSLVMPYDFKVLIADLLQHFGIEEHTIESRYNHAANFSGVSAFKEMFVKRDRIEFGVSPTDIAHLLLADYARYDAFVDRYKTTSPLVALTKDIGPTDETIIVSADVFVSLYRLVHSPPDPDTVTLT